MADDTTSRHAAQLARDYLALVWHGDESAAERLQAELDELEHATLDRSNPRDDR